MFLLFICKSRLPLLVFFHNSRVCSIEDYFSIKKLDILSTGVSSSDSVTINLRNSINFLNQIQRYFIWVLYLYLLRVLFVFFIGPMLHHSPGSTTFVGNLPRGIFDCLGWDKDTSDCILMLGGIFQVPANFRLSVIKSKLLKVKY